MDDKNTALSVQNLSHHYGKFKALDNITFEIQRGKFTALLGLNGAGKTTLLSLITRLYSHQTGRIVVFGNNIDKNPNVALANMGVVFQQRTLDLDLTIKQNLHYHIALHGQPKAKFKDKIQASLEQFNLTSKLNSKVRTLSGGQIRAVEIVRALLHEPKLLLLDEPTVGLDIHSREYIIERIHSLVKEHQIGVLYTTHLVDEIRPGDDVIILHKGNIIKSGPMEALIKESATQDIKQAFTQLTGEQT